MAGPYIGQMKSVLVQQTPTSPIIELFSDLPACDPRAAAYLLAAYIGDFPADTVFLCVVDPGVGSARRPVVTRVDGQWFVGPDNGLFDIVARHGHDVTWWEIVWRPDDRLASTFHGRDLFAPIAARLASGSLADGDLHTIQKKYHTEWPDDYAHVIYIDHFGNAITGVRASTLDKRARISVNNKTLAYANTFSDVAVQEAFWYENANGLVEIAVNQGRADEMMGIKLGDTVQWQE